MTWSKSTVKPSNPERHPIHVLYLAAKAILETAKNASKKAGKDMDNSQVTMPIWIDDNPPIKITLEVGPSTSAEHAIFKAQTADAKDVK